MGSMAGGLQSARHPPSRLQSAKSPPPSGGCGKTPPSVAASASPAEPDDEPEGDPEEDPAGPPDDELEWELEDEPEEEPDEEPEEEPEPIVPLVVPEPAHAPSARRARAPAQRIIVDCTMDSLMRIQNPFNAISECDRARRLFLDYIPNNLRIGE
jgi:hypothetical protein